MRTIELPLSRNYVRDWGLTQAARELIQNALDSKSDFEYSFIGGTLTIASRGSTLDSKTLILGNTSKADDNSSIGSFGEGYKIALLVLCREGYEVQVANGDVKWTPDIRHSDTYGCEILHIDETPLDHPGGDLIFKISGLSHDDSNQVREMCLFMQPDIDDAIEVRRGRILPSRAGKLYVGGLFVCETDMTYGYDFKPEYMRLDRDRQAVCGFHLKAQTKEAWFETQNWDLIAEHMDSGIEDLQYAGSDSPELVKEACYRRFNEANPGGIVASSVKEMQDAVKDGMIKTVYIGSHGYREAIRSSGSYSADTTRQYKAKTPKETLSQWAERNQRNMSHPLRISFREMINESANWRLQHGA